MTAYMELSLPPEHQEIRDAVLKICERFDDEYWMQKDRDGGWPHDFHRALADAGWIGIAMPPEYGGAGLGITEAAIMTEAISESGGGGAAAATMNKYVYGLNPIVVFGSDEQKRRFLPSSIKGTEYNCFAITEPNTGLNTLELQTKAERIGDEYVISGQKTWTSSAQVAHKMLILARTTPLDQVKRKTEGLSLFYTDLDRRHVEVREIDKMGRKAVDSNMLFIDNLRVPVRDRIGEEGKGFACILHGMNPERVLVAAGAIGLARAALRRATEYARERVVFGRPIGKNQGVQHPLAECWMEIEAARLMTFKAAALYDAGKPCGAEANAAKYLAAEAAFKTCTAAVMVHGGYGYAKEYHVERYLRESFIPRIAPVSRELILCHIAERVLGLPKSY
jgi:acyl-CoA dehydrogenase